MQGESCCSMLLRTLPSKHLMGHVADNSQLCVGHNSSTAAGLSSITWSHFRTSQRAKHTPLNENHIGNISSNKHGTTLC